MSAGTWADGTYRPPIDINSTDPFGSLGRGTTLQQIIANDRILSAVLGEIVWLMSQSPLHKQFFISDLEWFVMTPVLLQQFRTFYATDRPIGVVLWANVLDEVAERLAAGTTELRPQDWKSGDKLWVVEVIAPFGGAEEMVKDLKDNVFPTRDVHFVAVTKDGKKDVRVFPNSKK
jgi:cytolysin-activating lysine-acyltransferase